MAKPSAGLLIYRFKENKPEVFLVHPGGPLWQHKDEWSIPKGEYTAEEEPLDAAKREFIEETGFEVPSGKMIELKPVKYPEAYLYRGASYARGFGNWAKAIKDYEMAIEIDPTSPEALNSLASILATCKEKKYRDGKKAVQYGEKALILLDKASDNNLKAWSYDTLAAAYAETGDFDRAVLLESKAYDLYKPLDAKDKSREDFRELVGAYRDKQTYVQWAKKHSKR